MMKNLLPFTILLVVIIMILLPKQTNAQYHKFIDENKQWVIKSTYDQYTLLFPPQITYYFMYFKGDTIVNTFEYKK